MTPYPSLLPVMVGLDPTTHAAGHGTILASDAAFLLGVLGALAVTPSSAPKEPPGRLPENQGHPL